MSTLHEGVLLKCYGFAAGGFAPALQLFSVALDCARTIPHLQHCSLRLTEPPKGRAPIQQPIKTDSPLRMHEAG